MKAKVKNEAGILLWEQLKELPVGKPVKEWHFWGDRGWKFDFAVMPQSPPILLLRPIAIEIEGGAWVRGRHTRGQGFIDDLEKYNHATLAGYRLLRFTPQQVLDGSAIAFIRKVLDWEVSGMRP